jgi:hypothetical protein
MNPYQPPQAALPGAVPPADRQRLRDIATCQRNINMVILAYFGAGVLTQVLGQFLVGRIIVGLFVLGVIVTGAVFAVRMAQALYGTGVAVIFGILLVIPIVGLLALLVLNNRATAHLQAAGLKVGLLGAEPGEIARVLGAP